MAELPQLFIFQADFQGPLPSPAHRGKLLNVRDASAAQITGNAEIQNIKQILGLQVWGGQHAGTPVGMAELASWRQACRTKHAAGDPAETIAAAPFPRTLLQHGKVYSDVKSLRYGHLMIMTDQASPLRSGCCAHDPAGVRIPLLRHGPCTF